MLRRAHVVVALAVLVLLGCTGADTSGEPDTGWADGETPAWVEEANEAHRDRQEQARLSEHLEVELEGCRGSNHGANGTVRNSSDHTLAGWIRVEFLLDGVVQGQEIGDFRVGPQDTAEWTVMNAEALDLDQCRVVGFPAPGESGEVHIVD